MITREVTAFIHSDRIGDVVAALHQAGFRNLNVIDVLGLVKALDIKEQRYSVEIRQKMITEVVLELVCENENLTAEAVNLIRQHGRTGQPHAGWIYVTGLLASSEIN